MKILVVDDEKVKRITLAEDLEDQGHEVVLAVDGADALEILKNTRFDVVVTDLKMPNIDGLELLRRIKASPWGDMDVIMMTAFGSIPLAVEAVKLGAVDFITKPFRNEDLFPILSQIERRRPTDEPDEAAQAAAVEHMLVGESPAMQQVKRMVDLCARSESNVLLFGETGVGKDLIAGLIHRKSKRHKAAFVKVGCTLFPTQLIESELYGHEKGSFTGADQRKDGRFDLAEGGTLYLDDVDDIPLEHQAKLLRAIEEKVFERVGGTTPIRADVRIVASTKCNLMDKVAQGTFRQDLYYRFDVLQVNIPPLRKRIEDLPLLAEALVRRIANDQPWEIEPAAIDVLKTHDWPGNVRELLYTLERAYLIAGGTITAEVVAGEIRSRIQRQYLSGTGLQAAMDHTEREMLRHALAASNGNKTAAAASLGMKRSTFCDKLLKHGLE